MLAGRHTEVTAQNYRQIKVRNKNLLVVRPRETLGESGDLRRVEGHLERNKKSYSEKKSCTESKKYGKQRCSGEGCSVVPF